MNNFMRVAVIAAFATLAGGSLVNAEVQKQVKPTASGYLNVRSGPGTSFADIGDIPSGTTLSVLGYDPSGRWAIIMWQGQVAYVARNFLRNVPQAPVINDGIGMFRVTGIAANDPDGGLVVRVGPGRGFPQILVLPMGTPVNIVEISPDRKWSRGVFSDGGTGWMRNRYLKADTQAGGQQGGGQGGGQSQQSGATSVVTSPAFPTEVFDFPNDTAPVLTTLAPNSPVAVLETLTLDWAKVSVAGQEGYMHMQGTTPGGGTVTSQGMQLGLTCAGTEPFWTFQIGTDASTSFEDVGNQGNPIAGTITSVGGTSYPYSFQSGQITGQLTNQVCSDGMSDITYPWELLLNVTIGGSQQTVQGCCMLQ